MYKLIFYVPDNAAEKVKESIFATNAGSLGEYSKCSFEMSGIGQFLPSSKANPSIGSAQKLERVKELRVEILCQEDNIKAAISALRESHPYEEPAFEVVSICNHLFE